jgi:hypothetical protein
MPVKADIGFEEERKAWERRAPELGVLVLE